MGYNNVPHNMWSHKMTKMTETQVESIVPSYNDLLVTHKSKSGVIRFLHSSGMDTKTIHKFLTKNEVTNNDGTHPIRYQHVRNVLLTPIKKK